MSLPTRKPQESKIVIGAVVSGLGVLFTAIGLPVPEEMLNSATQLVAELIPIAVALFGLATTLYGAWTEEGTVSLKAKPVESTVVGSKRPGSGGGTLPPALLLGVLLILPVAGCVNPGRTAATQLQITVAETANERIQALTLPLSTEELDDVQDFSAGNADAWRAQFGEGTPPAEGGAR